MDDSIETHNEHVKRLIDHLPDLNEGIDPESAFYIQSFVFAANGEPASIWRWDGGEQTYVEITVPELVAELSIGLDPVGHHIDMPDGSGTFTWRELHEMFTDKPVPPPATTPIEHKADAGW